MSDKPNVIDLSKSAEKDCGEPHDDEEVESDDDLKAEIELPDECRKCGENDRMEGSMVCEDCADTEKGRPYHDNTRDAQPRDYGDVRDEPRDDRAWDSESPSAELSDEYPDELDDGDDDTEKADSPADDLAEDYPDDVEDNDGGEDDGETGPTDLMEDEYPDDLEDETPKTQSKSFAEEGEEEKALDMGEYKLKQKVAEKGFQEVEKGDKVLIKCPLEGAKVGEVTDVDKSWTGTLHLSVDTGANKYDVTPYDDEFSEKFLAVVEEQKDVTHKLLESLSKTSPADLERGDDVIIDVNVLGAVKGTVAHTGETETQGSKIDVKTGPVYFKIYEDPTPSVRKEQPYVVGKIQ